MLFFLTQPQNIRNPRHTLLFSKLTWRCIYKCYFCTHGAINIFVYFWEFSIFRRGDFMQSLDSNRIFIHMSSIFAQFTTNFSSIMTSLSETSKCFVVNCAQIRTVLWDSVHCVKKVFLWVMSHSLSSFCWLLVPFPIIGQLKKILKDYYDRMYICEEQKWDLEREVRKRDWEVQKNKTNEWHNVKRFYYNAWHHIYIQNYIIHIIQQCLWILFC